MTATSLIQAFQWICLYWGSCRHLKDADAHMQMSLPHGLRMEETLHQTGLINNSWEMVAQPSCLQPQTPTTTGKLNTHTILHIQRTHYKHNDSDMQELIFHHNGGILLAQNCWHKLAASEQAGWIPNCSALHVWRFRKWGGIYCHSPTEASIYKAQESGEVYVALWASVRSKLYSGWQSFRCLQQKDF